MPTVEQLNRDIEVASHNLDLVREDIALFEKRKCNLVKEINVILQDARNKAQEIINNANLDAANIMAQAVKEKEESALLFAKAQNTNNEANQLLEKNKLSEINLKRETEETLQSLSVKAKEIDIKQSQLAEKESALIEAEKSLLNGKSEVIQEKNNLSKERAELGLLQEDLRREHNFLVALRRATDEKEIMVKADIELLTELESDNKYLLDSIIKKTSEIEALKLSNENILKEIEKEKEEVLKQKNELKTISIMLDKQKSNNSEQEKTISDKLKFLSQQERLLQDKINTLNNLRG